MKKSIALFTLIFLSCTYAFAQSPDPQISDNNYKHPNKRAAAIKSGVDHHATINFTSAKENTNYKSSFKNSQRATSKPSVFTESPARANGRKTTGNYKKQF
jgi:hypothetical protein